MRYYEINELLYENECIPDGCIIDESKRIISNQQIYNCNHNVEDVVAILQSKLWMMLYEMCERIITK